MEWPGKANRSTYARHLNRKKKALLAFLSLLEFLISGFVTGQFRIVLNGWFFRKTFTLGEILEEGILKTPGIFYTAMLSFLGMLLTVLFLKKKHKLNRTVAYGKHGERITPKGTLGHSRMMTAEEAKEHFDVSGDINDHFDFLFGYVEEDEDAYARIKKIFGHRTE